MKSINERRQIMWEASRWKHYNDFRVFIMGIKGNNEIFGDGVIYEGFQINQFNTGGRQVRKIISFLLLIFLRCNRILSIK
ncbi:MAG: hypothetical protein CM15mP102_15400 [Flavobacteriales bacterium]|nr:MAG: hypothetical protein CM15mP102_15400 [Flavobacteriales bacterium]